jgi:hypothetical protein
MTAARSSTPNEFMNEPTDLDVILGGVTIGAKLRDGSTEEVKVRQLSNRLLTTKWPKLLDDQAALVELYCDKDDGWDDNLLPESHDEIIAIGEKLNTPRFARWAKDQRAMAQLMNATLAEVEQPLPASSPNAASS